MEKILKIVCRPRRDSNSQSSDPKSDALSIRPQGRRCVLSGEKLYKKSIVIFCGYYGFLLFRKFVRKKKKENKVNSFKDIDIYL